MLPAAAADNAGIAAGEIRLGNLMPYSGPASSYSIIGKTEAAYFAMVNDRGGINGRKVNFISYDDGYSPPKAIEQARRLVESDDVLAIFQPLGTPSNAAIQKYMNVKKVPQLFVGSGASRFSDPKHFPWTVGFNPTYETETEVYGKYILEARPEAKVAIIYQNDDSGRDQIKGLEHGLGAKAAAMIVAKASYEPTDPVIDSQILTLKASGADVLVSLGTPRAGSQTIRKVAEIGWKPLFFVGNPQASVASVLVPAGLDNAKGVISSTSIKDVTDPAWKDDADVAAFRAFMARYYPDGDANNGSTAYGYVAAQVMTEALRRCGDDLSRENVLRQATTLTRYAPALILPGITVNTSPTNYSPLRQLQLIRFDGERWQLFGPVISD
ncbi:ABC transporter substrate-binding protein [Chelatococcus reniformis]|nr:ABC transporter substrate-binding protein [Chelatococcus reniformis]